MHMRRNGVLEINLLQIGTENPHSLPVPFRCVGKNNPMASPFGISRVLPRVLIVSRRTTRKNKYIDFVGEYHLDLIVANGAVPVIVPRIAGIDTLLESFEPIHGVLLCEGEDINPSLYDTSGSGLTVEELDEVRHRHASDTAVDHEKDSIELRLARLCLERGIPFLGICRGSQVLNIARGGTLFQDVEKELPRQFGGSANAVAHIDYENYDGHRHRIRVVENTPLHHWFQGPLELKGGKMEIAVNSYHHQGVKRLGERFVPMAFAPDGLIEGFYDPDAYSPEEGKFFVGLQFHPERMRRPRSEEFDYPGCPLAHQEFVTAVIAYQKKLSSLTNPRNGLQLEQDMEKKRKSMILSFGFAKDMSSKESGHEAADEFLEYDAKIAAREEVEGQMGAAARNGSSYVEGLIGTNEKTEAAARSLMAMMSREQVSELLPFYQMMGKICLEELGERNGHCFF